VAVSDAAVDRAGRMPAAAVFDLDGTLVLSEHRNRVAWTAFFGGYGITVDEKLLTQVSGRRGRDSLAELTHLFPGRAVDDLMEEVWEVARRTDLPPIDPAPGAVDLVRRVAAYGTPLALVTSARRRYAERLLGDLDIRDLFTEVVTAEDVEVGKPAPDGYLRACRRLGVDPPEAVAFEDTPAGVAAVKAAGMRCVAVTTSQPVLALAEADLVVGSLSEVPWPPLPAAVENEES
jgi:beta-phosphoglucomutase-like phosphatase (HAD superfamily)